jgi:hypothetical protein
MIVDDCGGLWRIDFRSIGENGLWWMMEDLEDNFDTLGLAFFESVKILHSNRGFIPVKIGGFLY